MTFDRKPTIEQIEGYEPNSVEIFFSGQKIIVYEMTLFALEQATKIVEPYLASIFQVFQSEEFVGAAKGDVEVDVLIGVVMETLRSKVLAILKDAPVAILRAIGCMMNAEPDDDQMLDILRNATPRELMGALEKLNELNDFGQVLVKMTEIVRYLRQTYIPEIETVPETEPVE